ncbi:peroxiredoxin [Granulosicoccus antarcticus]|uniref:Glutathione-dependent peroxiredoxin n=1 Tax=Granulosicoccus antarcticus IMCC3135 TaxID=1192854 RepID=A0A2Z2NZ46_9GAMM|nr:peroxiredoxin [Granulosicoccus antarcticus]ASJ76583.1 Glutathione amide-dependent peroxidase [Granulosicoccus antarcticus IMCC3135]
MIKVGDKIPAISLKQMTAAGPTDVPLADYCAGRKVVIFALPGAFTPTCSETHVPSFIDKAKALRDKGVAAVACVSTSDFFVMNAWGKSLGTGDSVDMLADGNHEYTRAAGMTLDLSAVGLGERSQRYVMVLDDGVVTYLAVEEDAGSATVSTADAVLEQL